MMITRSKKRINAHDYEDLMLQPPSKRSKNHSTRISHRVGCLLLELPRNPFSEILDCFSLNEIQSRLSGISSKFCVKIWKYKEDKVNAIYSINSNIGFDVYTSKPKVYKQQIERAFLELGLDFGNCLSPFTKIKRLITMLPENIQLLKLFGGCTFEIKKVREVTLMIRRIDLQIKCLDYFDNLKGVSLTSRTIESAAAYYLAHKFFIHDQSELKAIYDMVVTQSNASPSFLDIMEARSNKLIKIKRFQIKLSYDEIQFLFLYNCFTKSQIPFEDVDFVLIDESHKIVFDNPIKIPIPERVQQSNIKKFGLHLCYGLFKTLFELIGDFDFFNKLKKCSLNLSIMDFPKFLSLFKKQTTWENVRLTGPLNYFNNCIVDASHLAEFLFLIPRKERLNKVYINFIFATYVSKTADEKVLIKSLENVYSSNSRLEKFFFICQRFSLFMDWGEVLRLANIAVRNIELLRTNLKIVNGINIDQRLKNPEVYDISTCERIFMKAEEIEVFFILPFLVAVAIHKENLIDSFFMGQRVIKSSDYLGINGFITYYSLVEDDYEVGQGHESCIKMNRILARGQHHHNRNAISEINLKFFNNLNRVQYIFLLHFLRFNPYFRSLFFHTAYTPRDVYMVMMLNLFETIQGLKHITMLCEDTSPTMGLLKKLPKYEKLINNLESLLIDGTNSPNSVRIESFHGVSNGKKMRLRKLEMINVFVHRMSHEFMNFVINLDVLQVLIFKNVEYYFLSEMETFLFEKTAHSLKMFHLEIGRGSFVISLNEFYRKLLQFVRNAKVLQQITVLIETETKRGESDYLVREYIDVIQNKPSLQVCNMLPPFLRGVDAQEIVEAFINHISKSRSLKEFCTVNTEAVKRKRHKSLLLSLIMSRMLNLENLGIKYFGTFLDALAMDLFIKFKMYSDKQLINYFPDDCNSLSHSLFEVKNADTEHRYPLIMTAKRLLQKIPDKITILGAALYFDLFGIFSHSLLICGLKNVKEILIFSVKAEVRLSFGNLISCFPSIKKLSIMSSSLFQKYEEYDVKNFAKKLSEHENLEYLNISRSFKSMKGVRFTVFLKQMDPTNNITEFFLSSCDIMYSCVDGFRQIVKWKKLKTFEIAFDNMRDLGKTMGYLARAIYYIGSKIKCKLLVRESEKGEVFEVNPNIFTVMYFENDPTEPPLKNKIEWLLFISQTSLRKFLELHQVEKDKKVLVDKIKQEMEQVEGSWKEEFLNYNALVANIVERLKIFC